MALNGLNRTPPPGTALARVTAWTSREKKSTEKIRKLKPKKKRAPPTGGARPKIVRSSLYYRTISLAVMISPEPPIVRSAMPSPFVSPKIVQVDAPVTEMTSSPAVPVKAVTTVKA